MGKRRGKKIGPWPVIAIGAGLAVIGAAVYSNRAKAASLPPAASPTSQTWRKLQSIGTIKAGQQLAIAIEGPNRTALTPDQVAQIVSVASTQIQVYGATKLVAQYLPGSPLPSDWPSDDDLGAGAYRLLVEALVDSPPVSGWANPPPNVITAEMWVR